VATQARLSTWGVTLDALPDIERYTQHSSQKKGGHTIRFSSVDFQGMLTVADPQTFSHQYRLGFGRAKAMGCGLMLIRPI
jgi:CRISPR system Cascade subunit CasE